MIPLVDWLRLRHPVRLLRYRHVLRREDRGLVLEARIYNSPKEQEGIHRIR